jgi:fimbrial isopeptide formation D2 family protein
MSVVKNYVLTLIGLLGLSMVWSQTIGGTVIPNQAVATYEFAGNAQTPETSNTVSTTVPSICGLDITPNGSVITPAQQYSGFVGTLFYLPYTLRNTGNGPQDYSLAALLDVASTLTPLEINLILDSNNNQIAEPTEPVITDLVNLAFAESISVLVEVVSDTSPSAVGEMYINFIGVCDSDASIRDDDNISQITILEGGLRNLSKSSVPSSGSFVVARDIITYTISFEVNEQPLSNVVISDVLDANLNSPSALTLTVNDIAVSGTSFDPATRRVTATLASLEPNDLIELTITTTVRDSVLGGLTIRNRATVDFDGAPTQQTNETLHNTASICGLVITPDGTPDLPAYEQTTLPSQTVIFPYTLSNVGNITATYDLSTETLTQSTFTPTQIQIIEDSNGNGLVDVSETEVSSITLAPDGSAELLLVVVMPSDTVLTGDAFVNIIGICRSDPSARDDNNVSQATIPLGGFVSPTKSSDPVAGTRLYPGVALKYFITFTANGRDLSTVVVSDVLSAFLEAPSSFSDGSITDAATGLSALVTGSYDAATRKLTWTLPTVPAGMTVRLEIITAVRADLTNILANTEIENVASVKSDESSETLTNTTRHPLSPIAILLRKTASPERVSIGETLFYTLEVINPEDSLDLQTLELSDDLPEVLRYQPNTSVVTLPDGSEQDIEPTVQGQRLTWVLPPLKAGEHLSVIFATTVLPGAERIEEIVNTAQVVASDVNGRAVADAAASVGTVIQEGALDARAVLMGTVFIDYNLNSIYDRDVDVPVENVRLYLSDGHSILSDKLGRYSFLELEAGIESLKVDNMTLPARLLEKTQDEVRAGLWRVRLEAGLITRQDVPLLPPGAWLDVTQSLNVTMGPLRIQKSVVTHEGNSQVILNIGSSQPLRNVFITDKLPENAQLAGQIISDVAMTKSAFQFALGDIPAAYTATIRYPITYTGDVRDVLIAPEISWDVRP